MIHSNPTNLELLRLATELVYSNYNNRRANLHNQWLADNDRMMKLYRTSVPYPVIPPYPTEEEIIAKAQKLIEFLSAPRPEIENQKLQQGVTQLIADIEKTTEVRPKENFFPDTAVHTKDTELFNPVPYPINDTPVPPVETNFLTEPEQPIETKSSTESKTVETKFPPEKASVFDKLRNVLRN